MGYSKLALKGISWMGLFRLVTRGFSFLRIAIIARILLPAQFGVYGVAALVLDLLETFTETGINVFLIQEKNSLKKYISTAWIASILRGSIIAAIILISTPFVASYFKVEEYWYVIALIAPVAFIRGFINPARVSFKQDLEFNKEFWFSFVVFFVDMCVTLFAVIILQSPIGIVLGLIAGALTETTLSFIVIKIRPKLDFNFKQFKKIFGRGKWITAAGGFNYLFSNFDDIIVGRLLGVSSLGIYQAAYKISSLPITEVSNVVRNVTFPVFVKFSNDKNRLKRAHLASMSLIGGVSASIGVFLFFFPEIVVKILLGENWLAAIHVIKILAAFGVIRSLTLASNSLFNAVKKQKYLSIYSLVSLIVLGVTVIPFTLQMGIIGAAYSALIGSAAGFLVTIYLTWKII